MAVTNVDLRSISLPVGRVTKDIALATGAATGEEDVTLNAAVHQLHIVIPEMPTVTAMTTLQLLDEDNNVYYTSGGLTGNKSQVLTATRYVAGVVSIHITSNEAMVVGKTFTVYLYYT